MAKFVSAISLALVVLFFLSGCATRQGGFATQQGRRYDWVSLEKYKKPSEEKEVAKRPGLFDWLKTEPEEEKKVAKKLSLFPLRKRKEKREVARKPWSFDWLKTKGEEEKKVAKRPSLFPLRKRKETKEVAKKPGLFDWLKRKPEKRKEAAEEARRHEPPRPEEKKEVAEKPGLFDWLKTEPEKEEEEKEAPEKPKPYDWATREPDEEEERAIGAEVGDLDLKLDYWMAEGEQVWSINVAGWKLSELVFPADTDFVVLTGEYRFRERWSADISYGFGDTDKGTTTDSDWLSVGDPRRTLLSHFDNTTGEASFWMVDLYCRLWTHNRSYVDAFLGFQHNENSFRMRDGHWVIVDYLPDSTPIPGLDMRYEGEFRAIRLGVRGERPLTRNREWTLEGSVAYLPWVEAEGKGFWNLRTDPAPPYQVGMHIEQKGGEGDGVDAYVAVNYRPSRNPNLTLELGYRFMKLKTSGGTTQNYWTEGTYVTPSDWKNMCRFQGFFFGLAYRF